MLIVEDDDSVREYLRMLLEQAGYSVIAVENGATALAYLRRVRTDVVVLDLMLPVLDGWSVAETMQRDPQLVSHSDHRLHCSRRSGAGRRSGDARQAQHLG